MTFYGDVRPEAVTAEDSLIVTADPIHREALDDAALMREVARGSVEAFTILVDRHSPALYRVGLRMLSDPAEAEECEVIGINECGGRLTIRVGPSRAATCGF